MGRMCLWAMMSLAKRPVWLAKLIQGILLVAIAPPKATQAVHQGEIVLD